MDPRTNIQDDSPSRIPACASCKHQRKKCTQNCVLAPFFPAHKKQEFEAVHQVFGVSNVVKTLKKFQQEEQKKSAIDSITWEALEWEKDPVHGPLGIYKRVLQEHQFYKNEYYKNQRKNLKSVHLIPYGAANGNGNGNGNGNVTGAEVISPAYTRTTTHTVLQNIRHNNGHQDFHTGSGFDTNSTGSLLLPQQQHSNGFALQYSATGTYNPMNNGNGKIMESLLWDAET